jgi:myo-inositol 2-dehydrogenase/D-chiro-inositol 1-dehydrogenase
MSGAGFTAPDVDARPDLRVAVLGVGRIGRFHAELLHQRVAGTTVAGVFDVHAPAAQAVGELLGVRVAATAEELLEADDVDAVAICTSTDTHAPLIVAAARAGKAIFCEKPISLELGEVDDALAEVRSSGVPFQIGFNRRYDPAHASVRAAVRDGVVGDVHLVRITSRDPDPPPLEYVLTSGGLFLDMTVHDFDMARFLTGSEVVAVHAVGGLRIRPEFAEAEDVDTAIVTLTHADGSLTAIDNSRRAPYGYDQRVEVHGSLGMAASENQLLHTGIVRTAAGTTAPVLPSFFVDRYVPAYLEQWARFVDDVRTGTPPEAGPDDARAPLIIGLAAWRSLREGRSVTTAEIDAGADPAPTSTGDAR